MILDIPIDKTKPVFSFHEVTYDDVFKAYSKTKSKAKGSDLPSIADFLDGGWASIEELVKLFNSVIKNSIHSKQWKEIVIHPLSEIKIPETGSDIKPGAHLNVFSKVFGRIVHG